MAQSTAVVEQQNILACSADEAWQVLADFGNFLSWATGGAGSVRLEGEGIGMIRHLDIPELGQVSERLDQLDNANYLLAYTMISKRMIGMARYSAVVQVESRGKQQCCLQWRGEFEPQSDAATSDVQASLAGSYTMMSQRLEAFVSPV